MITAKFLFRLGLRRQPELADLLTLAAGPVTGIRRAALKYFLDNASSKYPEYDPKSFSKIAYIPSLRPDGESVMGEPQEVRGHAYRMFIRSR